jgi:hypothetical protein
MNSDCKFQIADCKYDVGSIAQTETGLKLRIDLPDGSRGGPAFIGDSVKG